MQAAIILTAETDAEKEQLKRLAPKLQLRNKNVEMFTAGSALQITPEEGTVLHRALVGVMHGLAD